MDPSVRCSRENLLQRISGEYLEMPGMTLTSDQARRLWNLDRQTCLDILNDLVSANFLICRPDGRYARFTEGRHPSRRDLVACI
jgi:hypothetical protein